MRTSQKGIDLIKKYESLRLTAYKDPVGIWTIGYGHTGEVVDGMTITEEQADQFLDRDVRIAEMVLDRAVKVPLTQNQYDALISFIFNVGPGQKGVKDGFVVLKTGGPSTMLSLIISGDFAGAAEQFPRWSKAGGVVVPGLFKRRMDERSLFLEADEA